MSQQPCLPVSKLRKFNSCDGKDDDASNFDDVQNMDASEYLSRVVHQASALPETFVAAAETTTVIGPAQQQQQQQQRATTTTKCRRRSRHENHVPIHGLGTSMSYLISDRTLVRPPPSRAYLPRGDPRAWIDRTLAAFERLRDYLDLCSQNGVGGKQANRVPVPPMKDRPAWHIFCVGPDDARGNEGSYFDDDADHDGIGNGNEKEEDNQEVEEEPAWKKNLPSQGRNPDVSLLLQLDQVMVRRVLEHLSHYIGSGWSPYNAQRSAWVYALLARLDRPIHRDDASVLFGLLKELCRVRAEMNLDDGAGDDDGDGSNDNNKGADPIVQTHLARLNVLIAVVGIYFEQGGSKVMAVEK